MVTIKRTGELGSRSVKLLVYGRAGAGKTMLTHTLPSPIVLSAEGGLLSVQGANLPYIEIATLDDLTEAYTWLISSEEAKQFKSVALDSISEVAEVVLSRELKLSKDGRAAYGELNNKMASIVRSFRDIPDKHVYFSAKLEKTADEMGRILYSPSMPGKSLSAQLPYFFDEVLALRVEKDQEGNVQRALMTDSDGLWEAKDRSGRLDFWESPDLGLIINKIAGVNNG